MEKHSFSFRKALRLSFACCVALLGTPKAQAQPAQAWNLVPGLPVQDYTQIGTYGGLLCAGTGTNKIYLSADGLAWRESVLGAGNFYITAFGEHEGVLYVGTSSAGIFATRDTGRTWTVSGQNLIQVTSFTTYGGALYASSQGNGAGRLNGATGQWESVRADLPTYSFNADKIVATSRGLLLAAGANGTLYTWTGNSWTERYYLGSLAPGLMISDMAVHDSALMACSGGSVFRSGDAGLTWVRDQQGVVRSAMDRNLALGVEYEYLISNQVNGSWLQKRPRNSSIGTAWDQSPAEHFSNRYTYKLLEWNGRTYLAQDSGLVVRDRQITAGRQVQATRIQIQPNPSRTGLFWLTTQGAIVSVKVRNSLGQVVAAQVDGQRLDLSGLPAGLYLAEVHTTGGSALARLMIE